MITVAILGILLTIVAIVGFSSGVSNYLNGRDGFGGVARSVLLVIIAIPMVYLGFNYKSLKQSMNKSYAEPSDMPIVESSTVPTGIECTTRETTKTTTTTTVETTIETTVPTTVETTMSQQELSVKELKKAWDAADKAEYKFYYIHNGRKDKIVARYYDCTKYNVVFDHESQVVYISDK